MKQYPQFKTWKGLKGKESLFKSPESGSQGMFLGGDPSYVQKDQQLIQALGLNFKFVSVGAEPAQVARWSQLYKQKKPVIFYWYTPQYLNTEYQLSEVKLPARFKGCQDDAKAGGDVEQYKCAYDNTIIEKVFSTKFAKSGSPAYPVLKRWKWTNDDQEIVAKWIAGDHMDPDKAGAEVDRGEQGEGQRLAREVRRRLTGSPTRAGVRGAPRSCEGKRGDPADDERGPGEPPGADPLACRNAAASAAAITHARLAHRCDRGGGRALERGEHERVGGERAEPGGDGRPVRQLRPHRGAAPARARRGGVDERRQRSSTARGRRSGRVLDAALVDERVRGDAAGDREPEGDADRPVGAAAARGRAARRRRRGRRRAPGPTTSPCRARPRRRASTSTGAVPRASG